MVRIRIRIWNFPEVGSGSGISSSGSSTLQSLYRKTFRRQCTGTCTTYGTKLGQGLFLKFKNRFITLFGHTCQFLCYWIRIQESQVNANLDPERHSYARYCLALIVFWLCVNLHYPLVKLGI
jgi:hypothetical protein